MEEGLPQMKVIFLDFDDVLNGDAYVRRQGRFGVILDPEKLHLLKTIVAATGARIVLSTSWREHWSVVAEDCDNIGHDINRIFHEYGLSVFDKTPQLTNSRQDSILQWLNRHPQVDAFVVLDDQFLDAPFLREHFVRTSNYRGGLDQDDVENAIAILSKE